VNRPWRTGSTHHASIPAKNRGCAARWAYNRLIHDFAARYVDEDRIALHQRVPRRLR
jgi:hypothetical protein